MNALDKQILEAGTGLDSVTVTKSALRALELLAEFHSVQPQIYLNALLNYAWSQYRRPGSWEAHIKFDFSNYRGDNGADSWWTAPP